MRWGLSFLARTLMASPHGTQPPSAGTRTRRSPSCPREAPRQSTKPFVHVKRNVLIEDGVLACFDPEWPSLI